jgi:signal transduction histidine kinase/CheY-like chemotaxis protein
LLNILPVYGFHDRKIPTCLSDLLHTGRSEIVPEISETWLESFAYGAEPLEILHEFNLTSALLVPLFARQRMIGTISLFRSGSQAPYTPTDVTLAEELARRCGVAFENAQLYLEIVVERDRAEKASRAKDDFVAILSHELRTPLTAILGWARKLKKRTLAQEDPIMAEGLHSLEQNAANVARLVEDCLDIARISERKIQLQKQLVDLNAVVRAAEGVMQEDIARKNIRCSIQPFPVALWVSGDRTRLEQVLLNLLSNAVKYSESGSSISVRVLRFGQEAEIAVQDTGMGIEPEFLAQIFQPFRQGLRRWLASESGLGLGLAIAREIVHMHHGGMWAESQGPGYGSVFRVRLPLAAPPVLEASVEAHPPPPVNKTSSLKVLLVEDAVDVLNLIRMELEDAGFSVLAFAAAEAALEAARTAGPDVVVSDIKMPGLHGYDFIKQLRRLPGMDRVPAIALTGFGMTTDIQQALAAGYDAHLCKPMEVEQLTALILKLASSST